MIEVRIAVSVCECGSWGASGMGRVEGESAENFAAEEMVQQCECDDEGSETRVSYVTAKVPEVVIQPVVTVDAESVDGGVA
jgi:hypothetical protein